MLLGMNAGHTSVSRWGLSRLCINQSARILDIGCGGGKNMARMVKHAPEGKVCGLDYSEASVAKSARLHRKAVGDDRVEVKHGSVIGHSWLDSAFDIVTAFEKAKKPS